MYKYVQILTHIANLKNNFRIHDLVSLPREGMQEEHLMKHVLSRILRNGDFGKKLINLKYEGC